MFTNMLYIFPFLDRESLHEIIISVEIKIRQPPLQYSLIKVGLDDLRALFQPK